MYNLQFIDRDFTPMRLHSTVALDGFCMKGIERRFGRDLRKASSISNLLNNRNYVMNLKISCRSEGSYDQAVLYRRQAKNELKD